MLKGYGSKKKNMLTSLEGLKGVARERANAESLKTLERVGENLTSGKFFLAAFGGFSSGKSTFFNALLGQRLFPSQSTPTTAALNFLRYGKKEEVEVHYKTGPEISELKKSGVEGYQNADPKYEKAGQTEIFSPEFLRQSSRQNEESHYIRDIQVTLPAPQLLPEEVIWVDTPGTDSIIEYHKNLTYSLIDQADCILFFIYGPVPFKNSDWEFLKDIRSVRENQANDKFFFIVNAIDGIEDQPVEEVLDFIREQLHRKAGIKDPRLFPVSSKLALYSQLVSAGETNPAFERETRKMLFAFTDDPMGTSPERAFELSGYPDLLNTLSDFLQKHKARYILRGAAERGLTVAGGLQRDIEMERFALEKGVNELREVLENKVLPDIKEKRSGIDIILKDLEKDIKELRPDFRALEEELTTNIESDIQEKDKIDNRKVENIFHRHIQSEKRRLENIVKERASRFYPVIEGLFQDFNRKLFANIEVKSDLGRELDMSELASLDVADFTRTERYPTGDLGSGLGFGGSLALLGGLAAALIPGGMGFIGGFGAGMMGELLMGDGGGSASYESFRYTDRAAMARTAEKKAAGQINKLTGEFKKLIGEHARALCAHLKGEADKKISALEEELSRLQERYQSARQNREESLDRLREQEEGLRGVVKNLRAMRGRLEEKK